MGSSAKIGDLKSSGCYNFTFHKQGRLFLGRRLPFDDNCHHHAYSGISIRVKAK